MELRFVFLAASVSVAYALLQPQLNTNARIDCEHFERCDGCVAKDDLAEIPAVLEARTFCEAQLALEGKKAVFPVALGSAEGWRTLAKLAVSSGGAGGKSGVSLGLYKANSHDVQEIPKCKVHHPAINAAASAIEKASRKLGVMAFEEGGGMADGKGDLRYVTIMVERYTGAVSVGLVWAATTMTEATPLAQLFAKELRRLEELPDSNLKLHSVWIHLRGAGGGNAIFSRNPKAWQLLSGPRFVRESFRQDFEEQEHWKRLGEQPPSGDAKQLPVLYYSPAGFRQANLDAFSGVVAAVAALLRQARQDNLVKEDALRICELYGGSGTIGLTLESLLGPLEWLRCSDENPASEESFQKTVASMLRPTKRQGAPSKGRGRGRSGGRSSRGQRASRDPSYGYMGFWENRLSWEAFSAFDALITGAAIGANVIVVDPPRSGLGVDVLRLLTEDSGSSAPCGADRNVVLVYVSCGLESFKKDVLKLTASGMWHIESAEGHILFPGSNHIETVALFRYGRKSAASSPGLNRNQPRRRPRQSYDTR